MSTNREFFEIFNRKEQSREEFKVQSSKVQSFKKKKKKMCKLINLRLLFCVVILMETNLPPTPFCHGFVNYVTIQLRERKLNHLLRKTPPVTLPNAAVHPKNACVPQKERKK